MPVIKRYPNRKLYDTEAKQYVTLEGVAALVRAGKEVQVVDYANGEDLTAVTLTQVIQELERKRSGFVPQAVLTGLIRSGGETLSALRRTLASPLDLFRQVDEEIEHRLDVLVTWGELAEEEAHRLREKLAAVGRRVPAPAVPGDEELAEMLRERGLVTRADLQAIVDQLEALGTKLEGVHLPGEPESRA